MDATDTSNRINQLEFMSSYKETDCDLDSCVHIFAGDLNIHGREDWYLERDGWRDAWHSESVGNNDEEWTWKNEQGYTARFDRIYVHQGRTRGARCVRVECLPFTVEDRLSDHVELHAVFELQEEDGDCCEVQGGNSSEGDAVQSAASSRAVHAKAVAVASADVTTVEAAAAEGATAEVAAGDVLGSAVVSKTATDATADLVTAQAAGCGADVPMVQISNIVLVL